MTGKMVSATMTAIALLTLAACSPGASKDVSVEFSCDEFMESKSTEETVEVAADGTISVTLCSNATTGFEWTESASISDRAVISQTDHEFTPPSGNTVGAAGEETWTFKALQAGTAEVSMEYSQPWDGGLKGEWTFTLEVTVK
jgi:inhibitor of cysteine peptidase